MLWTSMAALNNKDLERKGNQQDERPKKATNKRNESGEAGLGPANTRREDDPANRQDDIMRV